MDNVDLKGNRDRDLILSPILHSGMLGPFHRRQNVKLTYLGAGFVYLCGGFPP